MTRAVGDEDSMLKSLREVVELFEHAQISVFKLMSSVSIDECWLAEQTLIAIQDSVPKFVRDPKYSSVLCEHEAELGLTGRSYSPGPPPLARSMSRSAH